MFCKSCFFLFMSVPSLYLLPKIKRHHLRPENMDQKKPLDESGKFLFLPCLSLFFAFVFVFVLVLVLLSCLCL
jgi:hypothetical protein